MVDLKYEWNQSVGSVFELWPPQQVDFLWVFAGQKNLKIENTRH